MLRPKPGIVIAILQGVIDTGTLLQDRFLIEDQIGKGGMGAVYRAIDQKFGSQVAIKETFYGDADLGEAFEREARLLNGLHHPILPHVSDYFTENGGYFLVMEYIEGEDLSELLKRGEVFPIQTVTGWAIDLLDGLDYLHSQDPPVIHRDIKPNNLKITPRGKIVLLDFGMAKETSSSTFATSVFGYSRRYSPLEQIEGSGTDVRSDIFSLGASIYHLVTGKPPIDVLARASAIVAGRPDPLLPANSVNPEVPQSIAAVLNSALALNPENRFESARSMSTALDQAIDASRVESSLENGPIIIPLETDDVSDRAAAFPASVGATAFVADAAQHESDEASGSRVIKEEDVVNPLPVVDAARTPGFNARSELRRRLTGMLPDSIPAVRIRRPARLSYVAWLPVLILCLGLVLYGAYRGFRGDDNTPTVATEPVATDDTAVAEAPESPTTEVTQPEPDIVSQPEEQASLVQDEGNASDGDGAMDERSDSIPSAREQARATSDEPAREPKAPTASTRTADRRAPDKRAVSPRPQRVVRPAFDQPSVSSIEGIMTGVPYERRRRLEESDSWEERRRRRLRRVMRENQRYQYPF